MMTKFHIPVGFRFDPTDEELLRCFLYPRIVDENLLPWDVITDRKLYGEGAEPWNVFPDADNGSPYYWQTKVEGGFIKKSIYVFTNVSIKEALNPNPNPNPNKKNKSKSNAKKKNKSNRIAGCGTWHGQTGPRRIRHSGTGEIIGYWKMLSFQSVYDKEVVGHWIMHEYTLDDATLDSMMGTDTRSSDLVLCKITKWIKIKDEAEAEAEAEALQYCSNNQTPINHVNIINNNNKRVGNEEIIEEADKKQKTSIPSWFDDMDLQEVVDALDTAIDWNNINIDF